MARSVAPEEGSYKDRSILSSSSAPELRPLYRLVISNSNWAVLSRLVLLFIFPFFGDVCILGAKSGFDDLGPGFGVFDGRLDFCFVLTAAFFRDVLF